MARYIRLRETIIILNISALQCDERCSNYSPCISTCTVETCDTLNQITQNKMCKEDNCIEGCEAKPCPEDHVYLNSSLLECVPRNACKVLCMEIDGVIYLEGDLMEGDDCYSCYCSRGKQICKGQPCTSLATEAPLVKMTTLQQTEEVLCVDGWSEWINQDTVFDKSKVTQKLTEIEPLPSSLIMVTYFFNVHFFNVIFCYVTVQVKIWWKMHHQKYERHPVPYC